MNEVKKVRLGWYTQIIGFAKCTEVSGKPLPMTPPSHNISGHWLLKVYPGR
jgi:hypothetical protein